MRVQFVLIVMTALITPLSVLAQDDPADGYAIITSRDTILGKHQCRPACQVDADCAAQQRCIDMADVGPLCIRLRDGAAPPEGWSLCEADLGCAPTDRCIRERAPTRVNAFIEHKRARGFDVHLVDETVWGGGTGNTGADNIRGWLQANYEALNLRYVLLIGDPRPAGDVPMRGTHPANNAHQAWADNPVVLTDFYFAELDGNWDLDGDGFLAEYIVRENNIEEGSPASMHRESLGDDMGPGGANRESEVAVGRIPFYGNVDDLDHILQKTMDYENAPEDSIEWRRSALIAAEGEHRAFFGELIRSEILLPNDYASYRVYDVDACWDEALNEDVDCRSPIDGVPESLICRPNLVEAGINELRPGFVTWLTHGSGRGAQAVMLPGNVQSLPDDRPFFTFQASCYNGQPTTQDNLAYALLKNGAIGTIGAATISHGPGSPMPSLRHDAGNAGMAYNFAERLITQGMTAGEALADLRADVGVANRWWYWKNYLTFNLWGDPSVGIGSHVQAPPPEPVDAGVDSGMPVGDAGMGDSDAGASDSSIIEDDSGAARDDAGSALTDAGPGSEDAVVPQDVTAPEDGNIVDGGMSGDDAMDSEDGAVNDPMTDSDASESSNSSGDSGGCAATSGGTNPPVGFLLMLFIVGARLRRRVRS